MTSRTVGSWLFTFRVIAIRKYIVVILALLLSAVSLSAAPQVRSPKITLVYTTAETSSSAEVVWNTSTASDSLLQYSTINPVPAGAPQVYVPIQVTVHDIQIASLTPATTYFYKVTSCARKGCTSATGGFETFPDCPDVVPAVSGSWQKDISPNVGAEINNELLGVAALSSNDVWAAGWAQDPNGPQFVKRTLIQHFNGSTWNIVSSPNRSGDTLSQLYSVAAVSTNDAWAVGSSLNGNLPSRTLIQHWNGTQWSIVSSPSPDKQFNELRGVAALSANDVWAVGYRGGTKSETPIETFILHWNGTAWTQVASPNIPTGANQLFGITAIAANDIWAVGSVAGAPLAVHWNGNTWNVATAEVSSGLSTEKLTAVSGKAANDVWAVGDGKGIFTNQTFATLMHWDGSHWSEKTCRAASSSNPPDGYEGTGADAYFTGVSAAAVNDVWAVGVHGSGPMILHWDGEAWTAVTHPRAFPNAAVLRAVATQTGGSAWSVGIEINIGPSGSASAEHTLIDQYVP